MDDNVPIEKIDLNISKTPGLGKRLKRSKKPKKPKRPMSKKQKIVIIILIILAVAGLAVGGFFLYKHLTRTEEEPVATKTEKKKEAPKYYSTLSGEEIADPALNNLPTFCVQIPNGMDGPRPQAGLSEAKIVF